MITFNNHKSSRHLLWLMLGASTWTPAAFGQQLFTANDPCTSSQLLAPRALNYWPDGGDFVTINGSNRFTRALYGGNTGFRLETSDRPEFALYMPNMGGNLTLSIVRRDRKTGAEVVIPLSRAAEAGEPTVDVECRYRPGHRLYSFTLPQDCAASRRTPATVQIDAMAAYECDAAIWRIRTSGVARDVTLQVRYGAATNDRFSREGDMGVDKKDCFDFTPERCRDNVYELHGSRFDLNYGSRSKRGARNMKGYFTADASLLTHPAGTEAEGAYLVARIPLQSTKRSGDRYFMIGNAESVEATEFDAAYSKEANQALSDCFDRAVRDADAVASSVVIETPDPFFNTLGGVMATAADAIWGEEGVWLHGSIGWRMPLCGWRAAYTGDVVGRHDRARTHFNNYAASQLTNVPPTTDGPTPDSALHLARGKEKLGTPMYSNGYICRMPNSTSRLNHYDMNLVYVDELLRHFQWTGSLDYVQQMWPLLTRHLEWEQRNFDPNNDGLYDAYCCIWASDALYYSGSAVTHSSAYNYYANRKAAEMALLLDEGVRNGAIAAPDGPSYAEQSAHYQAVANRILEALNARLWMPKKGVWAEYEDALGLQRRHEAPALWTVYHAIDSEVGTPRQAYAATRYVDREIPHIAINVQQPADSLESRAAYARLIAEGDYATVSTTNWQPYAWSINNVALAEVAHTALAYWQAGRNDAGFKLLKSALLDAMYLGASPGNFGQISFYDAARSECYRDFGDPVGITTRALVQGLFGVRPDRLNGRVCITPGFPSSWDHASIGTADYQFAFRTDTLRTSSAGAIRTTYTYSPAAHFAADTLVIRLKAQGAGVAKVEVNGAAVPFAYLTEAVGAPMVEVKCATSNLPAVTAQDGGARYECVLEWKELPSGVLPQPTEEVTADGDFRRYRLADMAWWMPADDDAATDVTFGSVAAANFEQVDSTRLEQVDLTAYFNESVSGIFHQQYLSPRAQQTTLALPTQGFGEWCHPLDTFAVDDSYLRSCGERYGYLPTPLGVRFKTPATGRNVVFTSQWDNFPTQVAIPLSGQAQHLYLLMTGSTNAMQSRIENGVVRVQYTDGTADSLLLVNPETWWPIDQDYLDGTPAFYLRRPAPYRQCLATERFYRPNATQLNQRIAGGATILLDLPVQADKVLRQVEVETLSNDVVIGLLSLTLQR